MPREHVQLTIQERLLYQMEEVPRGKHLLVVAYASGARDFDEEVDCIVQALEEDEVLARVQWASRYTGGVGVIVFWSLYEESAGQQMAIAHVKARFYGYVE